MHKLAAEHPRGSFLYLRFVAGAQWHRETWVAMAHSRGSGPRLLMLAACTLDEDTRTLSLDSPKQGFDFMMAVSVVGFFFKQAPNAASVEVFASIAPVDEQAHCQSASQVKLCVGWRGKLQDSGACCFLLLVQFGPATQS
jgi:hypothetical protein